MKLIKIITLVALSSCLLTPTPISANETSGEDSTEMQVQEVQPRTSYNWTLNGFYVPYQKSVQFRGPYRDGEFLIHALNGGYNYFPKLSWKVSNSYNANFAVYVYYVTGSKVEYKTAYTCSGSSGTLSMNLQDGIHTDGYKIVIANRSGRDITFEWMKLVS